MAKVPHASCPSNPKLLPLLTHTVGWWWSGGDTAVLILSTGVEAAAPALILLPNLKYSVLDHPHHKRIRPATQCLCSPTSTPTAKSSKKPKMQATGDMFPTNWSPPPIEFLTPRAQQAGKGAQAHRWVGTVGPQGLKRLACWVPVELEQKPQVSDPQGNLASLEELFWNTPGPSPEAAAPLVGTSFPCHPSSVTLLCHPQDTPF